MGCEMTTNYDLARGSLRHTLVPLAMGIIAVLSLGLPVIAPPIALLAGVFAFFPAHRSRRVLAWIGFAMCMAALVAALVIDFGLLAVHTEPGVPTVTRIPS